MFSPTLLDHFQNPRNVGELPPPAVSVTVSNPACGDILALSAVIVGRRIDRVCYKTRGCTASIAAGSVLTELLQGRDLAAIAALDAETIAQALGGLPAESRHAAILCADAVKALLKKAA